MKKTMLKSIFALLIITSLSLVGCGRKETVTDTSTETGTETIVAEVETSTQEENNSQEVIAETEAPTPTEEPTPVPTEEPTPEPTEEPTPTSTETPTPEPVHEHSYTETILTEGTCTSYGTKLYSCACGHSYEEQYSGNHVGDGNPVVVMAPTCTSEGLSSEHCKFCGAQMNFRVNMPATEHVPRTYWVYYTDGAAAKLGINAGYYLGCANCSHTVQYTTTQPAGEIKTVEEGEVY